MSGLLDNQVAIVTGGGWNIGRAIARAFARAGARLVIAGRNEQRLAQTRALLREEGLDALVVPTDVTDLRQVERLVRTAVEAYGTVDVMAAIAGGGWPYQSIEEVDPATWDQVLRQNLSATFYCARAVLPILRRKDRGSILTCAGGGAFHPVLGVPFSGYACAKAAICRFTDQLTAELWDTQIRINCLEPGMVWDEAKLAQIAAEERATSTRHPLHDQNHPPEDAAELALWLVSAQSGRLRGRLVSVNDTWWRDPVQVQKVEQSLTLYRLWRHTL